MDLRRKIENGCGRKRGKRRIDGSGGERGRGWVSSVLRFARGAAGMGERGRAERILETSGDMTHMRGKLEKRGDFYFYFPPR